MVENWRRAYGLFNGRVSDFSSEEAGAITGMPRN
jgi:hypothetical protein